MLHKNGTFYVHQILLFIFPGLRHVYVSISLIGTHVDMLACLWLIRDFKAVLLHTYIYQSFFLLKMVRCFLLEYTIRHAVFHLWNDPHMYISIYLYLYLYLYLYIYMCVCVSVCVLYITTKRIHVYEFVDKAIHSIKSMLNVTLINLVTIISANG